MAARNAVEKITLSRLESERVRMRKTTDKGSDVVIILPAGSPRLRHGDILSFAAAGGQGGTATSSSSSTMIVVEIEPENVGVIQIAGGDARTAALVGHAIGNLHRPIKVQDGTTIYFPVQTDDEAAMIERQLAHLHVKIGRARMVFEPEEAAAHVHEH